MTKENSDKIRWKCAGINYVNTNIFSFVRLPCLLIVLGIDISFWFEGGIIFLGIGIYKYVDRKYKVTKSIEKSFESLKTTILFSLINISLILILVFNYNYDHQKPRD